MNTNYRIFLDVCSLNRPFDDRNQPRIALEAQAILEILNLCQTGKCKLITSISLEEEINQTPNPERRENVKTILSLAKIRVNNSPMLQQRIMELEKIGFTNYDAAHIASAERGKADVFLSTDDRLVKKAKKNTDQVKVTIDNPLQWLIKIVDTGDNNNV